MANHKKKKHPNARSHCHMCKPWKDGHITRDSNEFEKWSDHVRRINISQEFTDDEIWAAMVKDGELDWDDSEKTYPLEIQFEEAEFEHDFDFD